MGYCVEAAIGRKVSRPKVVLTGVPAGARTRNPLIKSTVASYAVLLCVGFRPILVQLIAPRDCEPIPL